MAQKVKAFATRPVNPSLKPRSPMMEGKNQPLQALL